MPHSKKYRRTQMYPIRDEFSLVLSWASLTFGRLVLQNGAINKIRVIPLLTHLQKVSWNFSQAPNFYSKTYYKFPDILKIVKSNDIWLTEDKGRTQKQLMNKFYCQSMKLVPSWFYYRWWNSFLIHRYSCTQFA